jgi:hypothetical protein
VRAEVWAALDVGSTSRRQRDGREIIARVSSTASSSTTRQRDSTTIAAGEPYTLAYAERETAPAATIRTMAHGAPAAR